MPDTRPGLDDRDEAIDRALLYTFQLSNKDYAKMRTALSSVAFVRALEQDGWTVALASPATGDSRPDHPFKDEWSFQRSMSKPYPGNPVAGQPIAPDQPCFTCGAPFRDHGLSRGTRPEGEPFNGGRSVFGDSRQSEGLPCNFDPYYCRTHDSDRHSVIDLQCAAAAPKEEPGE